MRDGKRSKIMYAAGVDAPVRPVRSSSRRTGRDALQIARVDDEHVIRPSVSVARDPMLVLNIVPLTAIDKIHSLIVRGYPRPADQFVLETAGPKPPLAGNGKFRRETSVGLCARNVCDGPATGTAEHPQSSSV